MRNVNGSRALACDCTMRWHKAYDRHNKRDYPSDSVQIVVKNGLFCINHKEIILAKQAELRTEP